MKIILKTAANGVIKELPEEQGYTEVFEETPDKEHIIKLLYGVCEDLDLDTWSKFENEVIKIGTDWGTHYEPSNDEIKERINTLKEQITDLEEILRQ